MYTEIIKAKHDELAVYLTLYPELNVFFTWSKCHWCKKAQPEIEKAVLKGTAFPVLQLNADDHKSLQTLAGLDGYPTIRRYSTKVRDFEGQREAAALHAFFNSIQDVT